MQPLLYLCHRIPYPPNKGDKIRSYNILKFLSEHYQVHLGAFVDDASDFQYEDAVADMCTSHCLLPLNPKIGKLKSLSGFVKGSALGLPYYSDAKMHSWVKQVVAEHKPASSLIFCSTMAQYVSGKRFPGMRRYIDFIDIDSDKWAQYKAKASFPMNFIYGYEARKLFDWEKQVAKEFDYSFFVSEKESDLFKNMVPAAADKVSYFNNGVDTDFFSPDNRFQNPYADTDKVIVFTGAMDYWANVDAVVWFANEVLPQICKKIENVKFYIVGSKPDEQVKALAASHNVVVTGFVDDVRPYLAYAPVAVAPMRIARGVQNKVLEAMAMRVPTVTSPQGFEGINASPAKDLVVAEKVSDWVDALTALLSDNGNAEMGAAARDVVVSNYSWQSSLMKLKRHLDNSGAGGQHE